MSNLLDRVISYLSPGWGAKRAGYRSVADLLPPGEPMKAANLNASYTGAWPTRTSTYWGQSESITGVPHLNLPVQRYMRDRARSLCENNPLASSILARSTENVIGPHGFQLQVHTADADWNKKAEDLFRNWFDSADFYGRGWVQHQKLICNGLLRDGDIGALLLKNGQVQLAEGDYISSDWNQPASFLHDGIELDKLGRVSKFWLMQSVDFQKREWKQISPKDFIFIANLKRVNQYRGETYFAQSFDLFDQIKGYLDAVVLAQKIAACLAVFIRMNSPTGAMKGLGTGTNAQGQQQRQLSLEPGMVQVLQPGEDISQIVPNQPGNDFSNNLRMLLRLLGLSFGQPLELVLLDFSQTNYSSAKASLLQAQNSFEGIQKLLIDTYYRRVFRWRVSKFINNGLLEKRDDAFCHKWIPAPWPYLDPVKEIQAVLLEIDAGLNTETKAIMARGHDPVQLRSERAAELAEKRDAGIPIFHSTLVQELGAGIKESKEEATGTKQNITEVGQDAESPAITGVAA